MCSTRTSYIYIYIYVYVRMFVKKNNHEESMNIFIDCVNEQYIQLITFMSQYCLKKTFRLSLRCIHWNSCA